MLIHKTGLLFWTKIPICCFPCLKKDKLGDFPAKALQSNSPTNPKLQNLHWSHIPLQKSNLPYGLKY